MRKQSVKSPAYAVKSPVSGIVVACDGFPTVLFVIFVNG